MGEKISHGGAKVGSQSCFSVHEGGFYLKCSWTEGKRGYTKSVRLKVLKVLDVSLLPTQPIQMVQHPQHFNVLIMSHHLTRRVLNQAKN